MLADLDAWDEVPQDRWQFVAAIPRFYNSGDYRLRPEESPGITNRARGGASNGKRRGTEGNANALRGFLAELEAEGGYIAVTGETGAGDGMERATPQMLRLHVAALADLTQAKCVQAFSRAMMRCGSSYRSLPSASSVAAPLAVTHCFSRRCSCKGKSETRGNATLFRRTQRGLNRS